MENCEGDISRRYCRVSAFRACHWKYVGCRVSIENLVTRFFLRNACERVRRYRRKSKKMRAGRHPPFTVPGFPWLRSENGRNCEYFPNGKLYRCETKPFFFQREISSFLTSRPRYYDEFLIIYAVFFSFHFVKNNYNNYIVVRSSAELNKKCWN